MPQLSYVTLPTIRSKDDFIVENNSWEELSQLLSTHKPLSSKFAGNALAPVELKPREDWIRKRKPITEWNKTGWSSFRILDNVKAITMAVLDIDEIERYNRFKSHQDLFLPFEFAMYSSFSYTPDNKKMRIVLPLNEPIPVDEWREVWAGITAIGGGDLACKDFFRAYLNPSYNPKSDVTPISHHNKTGRFIDRADLKHFVELAKELYLEEFEKSKSRVRKTYDFSKIGKGNSNSNYIGEPNVLSDKPDVALGQLLTDPKIRELVVDCAKEFIPRFELALRLASHGVQKYTSNKFTYEIYETLTTSLVNQLPEGRSRDTNFQLQEYYYSALTLIGDSDLQQNHIIKKENIPEALNTL